MIKVGDKIYNPQNKKETGIVLRLEPKEDGLDLLKILWDSGKTGYIQLNFSVEKVKGYINPISCRM